MSMIFFTYRVPIKARKGAAILREAGVKAKLARTPTGMTVNGCGYGLWVPVEQAANAARRLREADCSFERSYYSGGREAGL